MDSKKEHQYDEWEDLKNIPTIPELPEPVREPVELSEEYEEGSSDENSKIEKTIPDESGNEKINTIDTENKRDEEYSTIEEHHKENSLLVGKNETAYLENPTGKKEIPSSDNTKSLSRKSVAKQKRIAQKVGKQAISCIWNVIRCLLTGFYRTFHFGINIVTVCLIVGIIIAGIVFARYHALYTNIRQTEYDRIANLSDETFSNLNNTRIYDDRGKLLAEITSAEYEYAQINEISRYIQEGYIAVEDKNFKEHIGIDPTAIVRAAVALVKNSGTITQGGSTITQQVVKNTMLTSEQTYVRKCAEILLAIDLEKKFTKAQIMEFYVNSNFYGNRCYGVEAACQYYFGKSAADVSISEAAMIVGISNSPSRNNPVANYDLSIQKRNSVLKKMYDNGVISKKEYKEAKKDKLKIVESRTEAVNESYQVSYAIYSAVLTIMEQDGFEFQYIFEDRDDYERYRAKYSEAYSEKSEYIRSGGFDIYTSLNKKKQKQLQSSVDSILSGFTEKQADGRYAVQGAAVCVDNETGFVTAIVGGRGTKDQYNRAYLAQRQPGSTIKPLLDYAPAFETGEYFPSKIMNDHAIPNGPKNSGGSYRGNVAMREAIARSINTIAYQTLQGIGVQTGLEYLASLRFSTISYVDNNSLPVSIGGFTNGVRVTDMAKGYATLASGGSYIERSCIRKIKQQGEGVLYIDTKTSHQVYSEDTSWLMTDCLRGTMELPYGTGRGCQLQGQICAGKTGTTNNSRDGWFCGYTTKYTTAVWVGRDDNKSITGMYGATYAGRIWQNYMSTIHNGLQKEEFIKPDTVKKKFVDSNGVPSSMTTSKKDYFSDYAENRRSILEQAREEERIQKYAAKIVSAFEEFEIVKVEDCFKVDTKYQRAVDSVAAISDDEYRVSLSTRVADKYSDLKNELKNWKKIMAAYNIEQTRKEEEARREAADAAARENALREKNLTISRFNNAIAEVQNTTGEVTDYTYEMLSLASKYLSECAEYSEYDTLLQTYNSEKARIKQLEEDNAAAASANASAEQAATQAKLDRIQRDQQRVAQEQEEEQ